MNKVRFDDPMIQQVIERFEAEYREALRLMGNDCPKCTTTLHYPEATNEEMWCPNCHWMENDDFYIKSKEV